MGVIAGTGYYHRGAARSHPAAVSRHRPAAALTIDPLVLYSFLMRMAVAGHPPAVSPHRADPIGVAMETLDTRALEEKIDHLIRICNQLADENRSLRDQQSSLLSERAALVEKSEQARSRVEAMISRLRAMEVGT